MPDKDKKKEKTSGKIPGQGQPADAALDLYWRNDRRFAEIFSKEVFNGAPLNPGMLKDASNVESAMIRMRDGSVFTLKQERDVVKSMEDGTVLAIAGIENQTNIDYSMPFRVRGLDFINIARQVYNVESGNHAKRDPDVKLTPGEVMSNYYRNDRIAPVFTLVIYYGKEEWTFPLSMADLYVDSPFKPLAERGEMHLLDVRHMDKEKLDGYSDELKAFLGYLRCSNATQEREFVRENAELFENLDIEAFDTLRVLTRSKVLDRMVGGQFKTPEGGVNVNNGYDELEFVDFVNAAQCFGLAKEDIVGQLAKKFGMGEEDARANVEEYWDPGMPADTRSAAWLREVMAYVNAVQRCGRTKEETAENLSMDFKLSREESMEMVEKYWKQDADGSPGVNDMAFNPEALGC